MVFNEDLKYFGGRENFILKEFLNNKKIVK